MVIDENTENAAEDQLPAEEEGTDSERARVDKILKEIRADKKHHKKAFDEMKRDQKIARTGRVGDYSKDAYVANIIGRHIKQKTAALYAKNPRAVAGRRETLDFALWDENPDTLMMAFQTVQQLGPMIAAAPPTVVQDPMGNVVRVGPPAIDPMILQQFEQAQATLTDFQQGMARRAEIAKTGKTLEILFSYFMREQQPIEFKAAMKQLVRRACTCKVAYVEVCFERETGAPPEIVAQMNDAKAQLAHLERLMEEANEGEIEGADAGASELQTMLQNLMAQPETVLREGLVFDFPRSTKVIPDRRCKSLVGFQGASRVTLEYTYTPDEVQELFGVDVGNAYTPYKMSGDEDDNENKSVISPDTDKLKAGNGGLVCVYKCYDKPSGTVYYVADGHPKFLREPGPPDYFVEGFWPVYALTFNEVEDEDELFPPSDVELLMSQQDAYNKSREGKREHRSAARPRWAYPRGALEEEDISGLKNVQAFGSVALNLAPNQKISDILQAIPVPGVDPNLYDTGEIFADIQLVGGAQEANYGGIAKATATESAISASATASSDSTSVDDLDGFLTRIARAAGQIMLGEMSIEQVMKIAGPGAAWPEGQTLSDIADELFLEVEAGSSGKPNQAVEMQNWQTLLPFLIQMPNINPMWLAEQTIKRLDDKVDLTEAVAAGIPSIVMQNNAQQPGPQDPAAAPDAQGQEGADNAPAGPAEQQAGSGPAFGSNQV